MKQLDTGLVNSKSKKSVLKLILIALVAVAFAVLLLWLVDKVFLYLFATSYVDKISAVAGLNRNLSDALKWVVFALAATSIGLVFSFSKARRKVGLVALFALVVAQPLALFLIDSPFDTKGAAQKCYVITRDTIKYGEQAGHDPSTGLECKPLTVEIVEQVESYKNGKRPKRFGFRDKPVFFSERTGSPIVWYSMSSSGLVEAFDLMGFNPDTSKELLPITPELAELWKQQADAPLQIHPEENFEFFDAVTGKPTTWYRREGAGEFVFFNRPGFNPRTGEPLLVVDRDVLTEWSKYRRENQGTPCYVLTRDSVRYEMKIGVDVATGRQCRQYSAEMLVRLREYEKGNRPKRIEASNPTFFDLRSGEPALWYAKGRSGNIELYSLMGFHPDTGEELLPVSREIAMAWKDQQEKPKRAPLKIDPATFVFFDQITGEPRAWYWRSPDGPYEFYDGPGYHPRTGDALIVLTKDLVLRFQKEANDQAKRQADLDAATKRADADVARKRTEELEKLSQSEKRCDLMASNPNDQKRVAEGVPFDALKLQAKEAVEACEAAIKQNPSEPRLQYQLARALQLIDRKRSFVILQKLVSQRYPAAFDNIGWIYYVDQKNPEAAVVSFRSGVDLNDSDSMVSLAEMIDRNHAAPRSASETKLALYQRASQLGNLAASRAEQVELQKQGIEQQNREMQVQQARIAGEMFNIILRGVPRR